MLMVFSDALDRRKADKAKTGAVNGARRPVSPQTGIDTSTISSLTEQVEPLAEKTRVPDLHVADIVTDDFTSMSHICDCCGKQARLPRFAPRPSRKGHNYPPMFRTKGYVPAPPIPENEIVRFSNAELTAFMDDRRRWLKGGDSWDLWELDQLLKLIGCCECDGSRKAEFI